MTDFSERIAKLSPRKLALLAVELQSRLERAERSASEPIAIVGMSCRVPGADSLDTFWNLLRQGVDAIAEVPPDRWNADELWSPDADEPGKMSTRHGGFLRDVDRFDANFFAIAPREASRLDPQQRLLLEVSWEALEHAAVAADSLAGSATGVFIGISTADYGQLMLGDDPARLDGHVGTGLSPSVAAGRLSYTLGLQGPAMAIDTACSSSLVAVHLACQSLSGGESRMAIAGGVNLILRPEPNIVLSKARMLAPDGRCKTFDASADGFGRSEGCGVIVLKRLADALADGDRVLAVIRGTAVNQDGRSSALTAPNGVAQEALIRQALGRARVDPSAVSYIEAHGTGTPLGDPIEIQALASVLCDGRSADRPLVVGSVKTNLGHLEAAAGIAGLIKVILSLQHGTIPPHLHFNVPNPHIPWAGLPISVPTTAIAWPDGPQIAGVSSFGFSGTNAHVIVERAPAVAPAPPLVDRPTHVLALSAKSETALDALASRYVETLATERAADVCFTAATGRTKLPHRLAIVGGSAEELRRKLIGRGDADRTAGIWRGRVSGAVAPAVALLFTGQGSQYAGMGRGLFDASPTFRRTLERCDELLRDDLDRPLLSILYPEGEGDRGLIDETAYAQPALFAIEYALAELLKSWGVTPAMVLGHSVGEYVAACVAGVMDLPDALRLIAARGRLMQALPRTGAMAAIWASEARVLEAVRKGGGRLSVAAVNGPASIVVSGPTTDCTELCAAFERDGVRTQRLNVSHAFHSALMDPMLDEFRRVAAGMRFSPPAIDFVSNVSGRLLGSAEIPDADYWCRHVRGAVLFASGVETLAARGCSIFLEVGPHPTLLGLGRLCLPESASTWLPTLRRGGEDFESLAGSIAELFVRGAGIDFRGFDRDYPRRRITAPTYPFERERYWLDAPAGTRRSQPPAGHPLLGARIQAAVDDVLFESRLGTDTVPFLADHRIGDDAVFPATAYIGMSLAAAAETLSGGGPDVLDDLVIHEPLVLPASGTRLVQTILTPQESGDTALRVLSRVDGEDGSDWRLHATCTVRSAGIDDALPACDTLETVRTRCANAIDVDRYYERMQAAGLNFGPAFRRISGLAAGQQEALGEIEIGDAADAQAYVLHPAALDACIQVLGAAVAGPEQADDCYLPLGIARLRIVGRPGRRMWSHVRLLTPETGTQATLTADVALYGDDGQLIGRIERLQLKKVEGAFDQPRPAKVSEDCVYRLVWEPQPLSAARGASPRGTWLVFADEQGVAGEIAGHLTAAGARAVVVRPGPRYERIDDGAFVVNPEAPGDFHDLYRDISASGHDVGGVLHAWSLDLAKDQVAFGSQATSCGALLHLSQVLIRRASPGVGVWIVTRGAQPAGGGAVQPEEAPIWGLARTLSVEHPELRWVSVDLDVERDVNARAAEVDQLWHEVQGSSPEDQIAFRGGSRFVLRLMRGSLPELDAGRDRSVRLEIAERGTLEHLTVRPAARRTPGPDEVELRVRATGINFRDVLNALGMYPGDPGLLGNECVGTVVAAGRDVHHIAPGDRVAGLGSGTFASFVTTRADLVAPVPAAMSDEEAATVPIAFLTVEYGLHHLAGMQSGDRVLIHAGAGGVGMAAVQLAQRAGAEIFATAGSDEKRALLRELGVPHVMDSRSLAFADEIMAITRGEGIDIVLNSLAGEFIPRSLGTLRANGRFIELGKTDIWNADRMAAERPDVAYHALYLGAVDPALIQSMLRSLWARFATGVLKPLPFRTFALSQAADAFRFMAQARHIGKLVIVPDGQPAASSRAVTVRPDRTYLVTGGYGALGLQVARWLVARGAHSVALMGRHHPTGDARAAIAGLESRDAEIRIVQGDVSRRDDVSRVLREIADTMLPLGGLVHAAGTLADGAILQQRWQHFKEVLEAKLGAGLLHELTRGLALDFFVMFSSTSAVLGNAGQANYAAANAYLDALAHARRGEGLPALSIDWGPWAESGMAAQVDERKRARLHAAGVRALPPEDGIAILERALASNEPQLVVLPVEWKKLFRTFGSRQPMLLERYAPARAVGLARAAAAGAPNAELVALASAAAPADADRIVLDYVNRQAAAVLGFEASRVIDPAQGLRDLGLDSLLAIELRNRLQRGLGQPLPATLAFDCPTVTALAGFIGERVAALAGVNRQAVLSAPAIRTPAATVAESDPIAIVGLGCRLPGGVVDPDGLWRLLSGEVDAIGDVPADRWNVDQYFDPDPDAPGKMYTRRGGFLERVDLFDPQFFRISPREAVGLDPQQRLLLEVSWEALEHAAISPDRLLGSRTGVFVGIGTNEYAFRQMAASRDRGLDPYYGTGNALSVAAGRLSYVLGLQGPAMSIDTACSSSLVAIHLAVRSLRSGECNLALAGGVNVLLLPEITAYFCRARMMSPDGICKTFDAAADGYVRSEGCGVVVLKRLSEAIAAGDRIHAVIRGSAVNQDGRSSGLTVPNGPAQQAVLRDALRDAGIDPAEVGYVEAHGTGTSLGDPIEIQALDAVFGGGRSADRPLLVGSVKTNLGHLEAAAGVAGLLKLVLSLQHGEIPRHLHFETPNPHIPWDDLHVAVTAARTEYPPALSGRRFGAVSSFGFSGTNAHVILEEAPPAVAGADGVPAPHIVAVSARTEPALVDLAGRIAAYLRDHADLSLADVASTLTAGRAHFEARLATVAASTADLAQQLADISGAGTAAVAGSMRGLVDAGTRPAITFLFTGQGAQYPGMGRRLYETNAVFRAAIDRCAEGLQGTLEHPLRSVLYPEGPDELLLNQTAYAQPALFAVEYALAETWRSWGIEPTAVMGHSVGEFAAAHVAGVFNLEDALALVAARGRLMQALPSGGAMAAVFAAEAEVRALIAQGSGSLSIAAVNGPDSTVVAGPTAEVDGILAALAARGIRGERLNVSHAFHSELIEPALDEFERVASRVRYSPPRIALVSNVTGRIATDEVTTAGYWRRHARAAVRFREGMETLRATGCPVFIEIGPAPVLLGMAQRWGEPTTAAWLPSLRRGRDELTQMLESLGAAYVRGAAVDWDHVAAGRKIALPTYPFQRDRYWLDDGEAIAPAPEGVAFERVIAAAGRAAEVAPLDLSLSTYHTKWQALAQLTTAFVLTAFRTLGAFSRVGERRSADEFIDAFGVLPLYRKVIVRWLNRLADEGWLRREGSGFVADRPLMPVDLEAIRAGVAAEFRDTPGLLEYVERGGRRLVPVLTGREGSLETLFPEGSFALAESLYETSPVPRYFNGIVRGVLEAAVASATPERRLRVLEIGAGVGGTTAAVVPALLPDRVVYYFTDLSRLFLSRAEDRLKDHPFMRYELLDIEQEAGSQSLPAGSFDVVIATNVLHATRDLRATVRNVRAYLAPGGVLVLNENTDHPAWFDLGLVEGWQRFDDDVRSESPVLSVAQWRELLVAEGFAEVAALPTAGSPASVLGQHVMIAAVPAAATTAAVGRGWESLLEAGRARPTVSAREHEAEAYVRRLQDALPAERRDLLVTYVRDQVSAVLRLEVATVPDRRQRLMDLGLDSLMAVELRNRLAAGLALPKALPATLMFDYPTIDAIAGYLERDVLALDADERGRALVEPSKPERSGAVVRIEQLTDEEAELLLLERLEKL